MENKTHINTVAGVADVIGKGRMIAALGVSASQINRAIRENRMSASWSAFCKKETGADLPDSLFYFKGLS